MKNWFDQGKAEKQKQKLASKEQRNYLYIGSASPALAYRAGTRAESAVRKRIQWSRAIWFIEIKIKIDKHTGFSTESTAGDGGSSRDVSSCVPSYQTQEKEVKRRKRQGRVELGLTGSERDWEGQEEREREKERRAKGKSWVWVRERVNRGFGGGDQNLVSNCDWSWKPIHEETRGRAYAVPLSSFLSYQIKNNKQKTNSPKFSLWKLQTLRFVSTQKHEDNCKIINPMIMLKDK